MNNKKIDWPKTGLVIAQTFWAIATYVCMLVGIFWGSLFIGGDKPKAVAVVAIFACTWLHWMLFTSIERKSDK